ncbi:methyltransferase domain-containing protein [Roseobacter sp. HKCCA0434]|uniref:methyltransferase domain-containing protein n=1 Tax=Roseobacter sp. HKCCA0434 TaxID=3079297 RepID=UPI0029059791|nr:methyltransferase domain-containing protein [Roseobacter sp. HKCCA0434]
MTTATRDWDAGSYDSFRHLRLRPARDLLAQVRRDLPDGPVMDLGCGTGAAAGLLRQAFGARALVGLDASAAMLEQVPAGAYDDLEHGDILDWRPATPPALIFSNAVLHWLPDHAALFAHLAGLLAPGGCLAIQMPRQLGNPSHDLIYRTAHALFPDRFDGKVPVQVAPPADTFDMLAPLGTATVWETQYLQHLPAPEDGHPVRAFTQSTAARPVLTRLDDAETARFLKAYDAALDAAYPRRADGSALMPFRRQFAVLDRP